MGLRVTHGAFPPPPPPPPPGPETPGGPGVPTGPGNGVPTGPSGGPKAPGPKYSGPVTPAPGGPASPGRSGGPITPAGTPPSTPGPRGMGPMTGPMDMGPNLESWRYWWEFNWERFLDLRTRVGQFDGVVTARTGDELLTGESARSSMAPTDAEITEKALPALFECLEKETDRVAICCALRAVGRIGLEPARTQAAILNHLASGDRRVVETAALALGILGQFDAVAPLRALSEDTEDGRKIVGGRAEVPWRVRTLATYGLGLTALRVANPHYKKRIQEILIAPLLSGDRWNAQKDQRVATIIALSLIPDPERRAVLALQKYFQDHRDREEWVTGHVPPAIARLLQQAPAAERGRYWLEIQRTLSDSAVKTPRLVRAGFAIALGMLAQAEDPFEAEVTSLLKVMADAEMSRFPEAGVLAWISLGQIAGSFAPGNEIERTLLERASLKGGRVSARSWAALGLGVAGFVQQMRGVALEPQQDSASRILLEKLQELRDPEHVSGFAMALGLRRHAPSAPVIMGLLDSLRDEQFRAYLPVALGLLGDGATTTTLFSAMRGAKRQPTFLSYCAMGLALLRSKVVVSNLLDDLTALSSGASQAQEWVVDALANVGDYRAVSALAKVLRDETRSASCRASAATSIGQICDRSAISWKGNITAQFNYMATTETVNDFLWGSY